MVPQVAIASKKRRIQKRNDVQYYPATGASTGLITVTNEYRGKVTWSSDTSRVRRSDSDDSKEAICSGGNEGIYAPLEALEARISTAYSNTGPRNAGSLK